MHGFSMVILCAVVLAIVLCGCTGTFKEVTPNPIAGVFNTALQVAAKVLSNEGTQKLATAAAQAVILSQVPDPAAQAIACKIVETAVPKITTGLSSVLTHCTTRKAAVEDKFDQYTSSEAFNQLILECTQAYERETN